VKWAGTKAKIREIDSDRDSPERVAIREDGRERLRAEASRIHTKPAMITS
jgi:hypothetical protein